MAVSLENEKLFECFAATSLCFDIGKVEVELFSSNVAALTGTVDRFC